MYLDQYSPIKYQRIHGTTTSLIYNIVTCVRSEESFKEKSGHPRRRPLPAENLHQPLPQHLRLCQVSDYHRTIIVCRWYHPTQVFERGYHLQGASIRTEIPGCDQPLLIRCQVPTLNLSNVKLKWAYINQYSPIKIYQRLYGTMVYILLKMSEKYCGNSSYLWS